MKPWLRQSGECFDSRGVPICQGDLLRTLHFIGPRRKRYYLYHVVVAERDVDGNLFLRMVPVCHLDPALRESSRHHGGNPILSDDLASLATVIDGPPVGDALLVDERQRRPKAEAAGAVGGGE